MKRREAATTRQKKQKRKQNQFIWYTNPFQFTLDDTLIAIWNKRRHRQGVVLFHTSLLVFSFSISLTNHHLVFKDENNNSTHIHASQGTQHTIAVTAWSVNTKCEDHHHSWTSAACSSLDLSRKQLSLTLSIIVLSLPRVRILTRREIRLHTCWIRGTRTIIRCAKRTKSIVSTCWSWNEVRMRFEGEVIS